MSTKTSLITSAALITAFGLTAAMSAVAGKPAPGECRGKKCDDPGGRTGIVFQVDVADDPAVVSLAPAYDPSCDGLTEADRLHIRFPRHDLCASFMTSTGVGITDDIYIEVQTNSMGDIDSVQVFGQDTIGEDALMHKSAIIPVFPPVTPSDEGFTLIINQDNIPVYNCNKHLSCGKRSKRLEYAGDIAVDVITYTPVL